MEPIKLSMCILFSVFIISMIVLYISKPKFILLSDRKTINWKKLISISLLFGITTAIFIYISKVDISVERNANILTTNKNPIFGFQKSSNCY